MPAWDTKLRLAPAVMIAPAMLPIPVNVTSRRPGDTILIQPHPEAIGPDTMGWFAQPIAVWVLKIEGRHVRVGIEAAGDFGWDRWLGPDGIFLGMTSFGASAPFEDLYRYFGITADAIAAAVKRRLG